MTQMIELWHDAFAGRFYPEMDDDERTAAATIQIAEDDPDAREFCPPMRLLALSFFNPWRDTSPPDPTKVPKQDDAPHMVFPPAARFTMMRIDNAWYESPMTFIEELRRTYETKRTTKTSSKNKSARAQVA